MNMVLWKHEQLYINVIINYAHSCKIFWCGRGARVLEKINTFINIIPLCCSSSTALFVVIITPIPTGDMAWLFPGIFWHNGDATRIFQAIITWTIIWSILRLQVWFADTLRVVQFRTRRTRTWTTRPIQQAVCRSSMEVEVFQVVRSLHTIWWLQARVDMGCNLLILQSTTQQELTQACEGECMQRRGQRVERRTVLSTWG